MTDIFMLVAFGGLAAAIIATRLSPRPGRITFWSGTLVACVSVFLMGLPDDWLSGAGMSLFIGCAIVVTAYVHTDFILIGGKTYSLYASSGQIDDYGGGLTAKKAWWIVVIGVTMLLLIGATNVVTGDRDWVAGLALAVVILGAISFGYRDALMSKSVAAGQRLQFGLLLVATIGVFNIAYLAAYHASKRWLLKHQAYGRHQK